LRQALRFVSLRLSTVPETPPRVSFTALSPDTSRPFSYEYEAKLTTESAASSGRQPILIDVGQNKPVQLYLAALAVIVEATDEERKALSEAGYQIASEVGSVSP
jgi:hypothetical protein